MVFSNEKRDLRKASTVSNIFRIIEVLSTFSNDDFGNNQNNIWNSRRKMKILVEPPLDLPIKVHGRKFTTNLFDVKDVFVSFHY